MYIGSQDALVAAYPNLDNILEDEERIKIFIDEENKKNIKIEDKLGN